MEQPREDVSVYHGTERFFRVYTSAYLHYGEGRGQTYSMDQRPCGEISRPRRCSVEGAECIPRDAKMAK